jgi:hypothetical protein
MKTFDRIVAWAVLVFGCLHITVSVVLMTRNLNLESAWSFAGGLGILFAAALNLIRAYRPPDNLIVRTSVIVNLLVLTLSVILCWVLRNALRQNPQAVVFLALAVLQLLLSARQLDS